MKTYETFASMRPGQLTPENPIALMPPDECLDASMRPGQLTPENTGKHKEYES